MHTLPQPSYMASCDFLFVKVYGTNNIDKILKAFETEGIETMYLI